LLVQLKTERCRKEIDVTTTETSMLKDVQDGGDPSSRREGALGETGARWGTDSIIESKLKIGSWGKCARGKKVRNWDRRWRKGIVFGYIRITEDIL